MSDEHFVAENTFYVRYAETDAMQVVHHASYIVWLEEGRSEYLRQRGHNYADMQAEGYYLAVTGVNLRYHRSMVYGQRATVRTWVNELRSRMVRFGYEVLHADTGERCVSGETTHICITHDGQPAKIPESWRI